MITFQALFALALTATRRGRVTSVSAGQRRPKPPHRTTKNTKRGICPLARGIKHPARRRAKAARIYCIKGVRP